MKDERGRRLTRDQKIAVSARNLNPKKWVCVENNSDYFIIRHKLTGNTRMILKGGKRWMCLEL